MKGNPHIFYSSNPSSRNNECIFKVLKPSSHLFAFFWRIKQTRQIYVLLFGKIRRKHLTRDNRHNFFSPNPSYWMTWCIFKVFCFSSQVFSSFYANLKKAYIRSLRKSSKIWQFSSRIKAEGYFLCRGIGYAYFWPKKFLSWGFVR